MDAGYQPHPQQYVPFPLIFFGCGVVTSASVDTPVTTDCIAPTLAQVMRIRAPNACTTAALGGFAD